MLCDLGLSSSPRCCRTLPLSCRRCCVVVVTSVPSCRRRRAVAVSRSSCLTAAVSYPCCCRRRSVVIVGYVVVPPSFGRRRRRRVVLAASSLSCRSCRAVAAALSSCRRCRGIIIIVILCCRRVVIVFLSQCGVRRGHPGNLVPLPLSFRRRCVICVGAVLSSSHRHRRAVAVVPPLRYAFSLSSSGSVLVSCVRGPLLNMLPRVSVLTCRSSGLLAESQIVKK